MAVSSTKQHKLSLILSQKSRVDFCLELGNLKEQNTSLEVPFTLKAG